MSGCSMQGTTSLLMAADRVLVSRCNFSSNSVLKSNKRVRDKGGGKLACDLS